KTEETGNWDAAAEANPDWSEAGAAGDVAALAASGNWEATEGASDWAAEGAANSGWGA
ncbi:hypothetical protein GGI12_005800, partial [Dipsacomyces acuminosporus]